MCWDLLDATLAVLFSLKHFGERKEKVLEPDFLFALLSCLIDNWFLMKETEIPKISFAFYTEGGVFNFCKVGTWV